MLSVTFEGGGATPWENAPAGIHKANCCDVVDLGQQETQFGTKHQIVFVFELDKTSAGFVEATGHPFTARTQRFNMPAEGRPLNEKSSLYSFLCSWRGKPIKHGENIPLEKLVGIPATLVLTTKVSKTTGNEYTAIDTLTPKRKEELFPPLSGNYTPRPAPADNGAAPPPTPAPAAPAAAPVPQTSLADDEVPF